MRTREIVAGAVALAVSSAASVSSVRAQGPAPDAPTFRYSVEGYLAQYALDDKTNSNSQSIGGFGLRLMAYRGASAAGGRGALDRASTSVFATFTPDQGTPKGNSIHVGAAIDVPFFRAPLGGVLDPFASVGLGVFHTSRDVPNTTGGSGRLRRSDLALTPGVGTRIPFFNGIGARADLRAPIVFGFQTTANFVAEGGLYVSF
ncbi:MAG: hypothetical protein JO180_12575 [Gemmatirosa sp.]|nr:hypothetical protein [Gemmatirosa sp.]